MTWGQWWRPFWWLRNMHFHTRLLLNFNVKGEKKINVVSSEWCKPWALRSEWMLQREGFVYRATHVTLAHIDGRSVTQSLPPLCIQLWNLWTPWRLNGNKLYKVQELFSLFLGHREMECWIASHNIWSFVVFSWQTQSFQVSRVSLLLVQVQVSVASASSKLL